MDLLEAISQDNLKQVRSILEIDHSININDTVRNQQGQNTTTPLVRACQRACKGGKTVGLAIVELLFEHKAEVNKQTQCVDGLLPLYVACEGGDVALVKLLLSKGAYVDTQVRLNKMSPLHIAIRNGHLKIIEMLLGCDADVDVVSYTGTPLYEAVAQGTTQIAKMLLERGADVNKTSPKTNETALHKSVAMDYVGMTRLLVEAGAETSIKMKANLYTPLCVAVEKKNKNCMQYLLNLPNVEIDVVTRDRRTPLGIAAQFDNVEIMKLLIQAGADINYLDSLEHDGESNSSDEGQNSDESDDNINININSSLGRNRTSASLTPLMLAAKHGHRRGVELLLQKGASPHIRNGDGNTALHYAVFDDPPGCKDELKITKICSFLLRGRASPNVKNNHGVSPFYYAVRRRMLFILEPFLASGADANAGNEDESSALHFLADYAPSYKLLAKYRADVNKQNAEGRSPIHVAAASYDTTEKDLALLFKEFESTMVSDTSSIVNYDGELPVHTAKKMEILEFFKRHNETDLSAITWSGDSLLHCMIKNRLPASDVKKALKWKCLDTGAVNSDEQTALELSKLMLNSEVFRVLDEDKREKETALNSPRKVASDKKKQSNTVKLDKKPTTNINKKPCSNSNSSKKEAPAYLKPTENQKNRVQDDTDAGGWDTHLRDGKISEFHPLQPPPEKKTNEGVAVETPSYARATENLINKQNDAGEYENKDWSKNFRNSEGVAGGEKSKRKIGGGKDNHKAVNKKAAKNQQKEKTLVSTKSGEDKSKIEENDKEKSEEDNNNNNNNSENEEPNMDNSKIFIDNKDKPQQQQQQQQHKEFNNRSGSDTNDADSESSSPRKNDNRTLSFGGEESIYYSDDDNAKNNNNNNNNILPSPTQSEEELAVLFGEKRSRVCSFYDSPTSGEDEVLYDGYDEYLGEDGSDTVPTSRKSRTKLRKTDETTRINEENIRKSDGETTNKKKLINRKATGPPSQSKNTDDAATKVKKLTKTATDDSSTKTKKQATSVTTKTKQKNDKQTKINKGKTTSTTTNKNKKSIPKRQTDSKTTTTTTTATTVGSSTNRTTKRGVPTKPTTTTNSTKKITSPRKQLTQDGKSDPAAPVSAEPKYEFCDVAVIVEDDKEATQKADQMCEYIKRRGRVFVARQPHSTNQNKEGKTEKSQVTKTNNDFKRMLKQSKVVLVIMSETMKTDQSSLEFCAYADRLNKPVYPLLLEGKKTMYEPSCLLDLMVGDRYHYEVGVHYEQEMGKLLDMIKDKIKT